MRLAVGFPDTELSDGSQEREFPHEAVLWDMLDAPDLAEGPEQAHGNEQAQAARQKEYQRQF